MKSRQTRNKGMTFLEGEEENEVHIIKIGKSIKKAN